MEVQSPSKSKYGIAFAWPVLLLSLTLLGVPDACETMESGLRFSNAKMF